MANNVTKTVAIDFDGVIAHYAGWLGIDIFGEPISGAKEEIQKMKDMGFYIVIHTARKPTPSLEKYLKDNGIIYDEINWNSNHEYPQDGGRRKVIADVYIDDRGICFTGNWSGIAEQVEISSHGKLENLNTLYT